MPFIRLSPAAHCALAQTASGARRFATNKARIHHDHFRDLAAERQHNETPPETVDRLLAEHRIAYNYADNSLEVRPSTFAAYTAALSRQEREIEYDADLILWYFDNGVFPSDIVNFEDDEYCDNNDMWRNDSLNWSATDETL